MELLESLIVVSEKAANIARSIREDSELFALLVQQKGTEESNPRFERDFKTLADVLIQEMVKRDIGRKFPVLLDRIHGEESNVFSNKLDETICIEIFEEQEKTSDLLKKVLNDNQHAAEVLAAEVHRELTVEDIRANDITTLPAQNFCLDLENCSIWIDPIDSTAEYINGQEVQSESDIYLSGLKCVTVLIGVYDRVTGLPVLGVINQPFNRFEGDRWHGKCFWGAATPQTCITSLKSQTASSKIICLSSSEDASLKKQLLDAGYQIIEAAGAGYKLLTVIEGAAAAYIISKNTTFQWDTCGPQAVLRALGGDITPFKIREPGRGSLRYGVEGGSCNTGGVVAFRQQEVLDDLRRVCCDFMSN